MNHLEARAMLAALPDGSLPATTEAAVRAHMDGCPRCVRHYTELERSEQLLRLLPVRFVPENWGPEADRRLMTLAAWAGAPMPIAGNPAPLQALGSLAAACVLAVLLCTASFIPHADRDASMALASISVPEMRLLPPSLR